jgi:hypothetical protein
MKLTVFCIRDMPLHGTAYDPITHSTPICMSDTIQKLPAHIKLCFQFPTTDTTSQSRNTTLSYITDTAMWY